MRYLSWFLPCILLVAAGLWISFSRPRAHDPVDNQPLASVPAPATVVAQSATPPARVTFRDLAKSARLDFHHFAGPTSMHYVPEIMGGGVAWLDYDQDGYLDLFLVQGVAGTDRMFPPDPDEKLVKPTSRLYRNQGDGTFVDVTFQVGLVHPGYGQGVAVGDYDNDGFPDLFITCFGSCHLFHNEPDGRGGRRFRDVTKEAGVELDGWCSCCAFGDLHGTGYLDLFVGRYVALDFEHYPFCGDRTKEPPLRISCGPKEFNGSPSVLFRNNANGTFTNVSTAAGLERDGKALGVLILDLDGDGKPDLFVGNDEVPNFHYKNLGNGKLKSCGLLSGTAMNGLGKPMGSMGVEADDLLGNGRPDLFITTFYQEGTTLFRNDGNNLFTDVSRDAGMRAASWYKVGWGTCFLDVDHDGILDIFVANGHVYRNAADIMAKAENGEPYTFQQVAQLFRGVGKGHFEEISGQAGPYFHERHVGRGLAMGDYDNDGQMDVAINNCGEPAVLLHNESRTPNHWIRLQIEGARHRTNEGSNRDAIGARVAVRVGGRTVVRHVKGGGSYYSSSDRRLLIGLGSAVRADAVEVRWPNAAASVQRFGPLEADRSYKITEGASEAVPAACPPLRKAD